MSQLLTQKVQMRSLVDLVTERLEAAIIGGELAPGDRLSEHSLASTLGVSRGPLREAIRRLEGRRLVERTPNVGVRVASLSQDDLVELLVVREALEGMACALAAERITASECSSLDRLLQSHQEQIERGAEVGYYQEGGDFDFHVGIARASRNARLIAMICGDLYDLLRVYRYKSSTMAGRARHALEEHRAILEALELKNPELAEQRMRAHLRNARSSTEIAFS